MRNELAVLREVVERVLHEQTAQLLTLVGAPGIGKSRLVFETMQVVAERRELIVWRQGRSLPYGEGVSFWALAEIVKAQAGILDGDSPGEIEAKLRRAAETAAGEEADGCCDTFARSSARPMRGMGLRVRWNGLPRGVGSWKGSPRSRPRCSCSRISTGPTTVCSTSSTTWSNG